jgi:tetratricopeptide (TPR) repeat protein
MAAKAALGDQAIVPTVRLSSLTQIGSEFESCGGKKTSYDELQLDVTHASGTMTDSWRTCFVLMPYGPGFDEIYRSAVQPAVLATGLRVLRHDDLTRPSLTGSRIWEGLREADIVVADVTGKNPNVFYELGITHAIGKPTVLIARDSLDVPFDLKHLRVIVYKTDPRSLEILRGQLKDALRRVIEASSDQSLGIATRSSIADQMPASAAIRTVLERADQEMARGEYREAITSLQEAAGLQEKSDDLPGLARTFNFLGSAYQATGQYDAALLWLQKALDISKRIGEPRSQAAAAGNLANVLASTGDLERARRFYEEALALSRTVGDANLEANTVANLGHLLYQMGRLDDAEKSYDRALQLFQAIGSLHAVAITHANLAALMLNQERLDDAESRLREAEGIFEALHDRASLASVWHNLASLMIDRKDFASAQSLLERSLKTKKELGDNAGSAASLSSLGRVYSATGQVEKALDCYQRAAQLQESIGDRYGLANTLSNIGQMSAMLGERSAAEGFFEKALAIAESIGAPERVQIANHLSALRNSLQNAG